MTEIQEPIETPNPVITTSKKVDELLLDQTDTFAQDERAHMNVMLLPEAARSNNITFSPPEEVEGAICEEVALSDITDEHIDLTKRMLRVLSEVNGLGLAAPQIGIKKKFFVYWDTRTNTPHACYNPKYFPKGKIQAFVEKCLTYGKLGFAVQRYKYIQAVWYEYDSEKKELVRFTGPMRDLQAEVFQHETDHLNGITIATKGILTQ